MWIWKLFCNSKGWATPSRWSNLLCYITKRQEYLKSCGEGKKLLCYFQQYNVFITAYSLISLTINYCGCGKMTKQVLNKVLPMVWTLRARFTGVFQALRVPGCHCAFIFQDPLPERDLGQTAWASCFVSHKDSWGTAMRKTRCLLIYLRLSSLHKQITVFYFYFIFISLFLLLFLFFFFCLYATISPLRCLHTGFFSQGHGYLRKQLQKDYC